MRLNGKSPSVQRLQRLTQPSEDQREGKYCHAILPHHFSHISATVHAVIHGCVII